VADREIEWVLSIQELAAEPNSNKAARLKRQVRQQHRAGKLTDDVAAVLINEIERCGRIRSSSSNAPTSDDYDRVKRALVSFFFEVIRLPIEKREQLVADLATTACLARGGIDAGRRRVSNKASTKHLIMRDVRFSLERAGLPVPQWEHHYEYGSESFFFAVAHKLGDVFGLDLPQDLGPLAKQAAKIKYGEMSPTMKAAQEAELLAIRRQGYTLVEFS
jgi:hypothetical protein